ncbi:MAG: hypothetical protein KatS3mg102_0928 [Planctomycetota bacterium]|nr:MAG: hypothetical protein KatS3mg102_0928 [Planctomycetota bacterium]
MSELVECVPNFSEGRRPEVIEAIAQAICSVPGVALLDRSMDPDHHRTVLTFAGRAEPVGEAAFRAAACAAARIDLRQHQGVHPRLGACDVIPFVPLGTTPMQRCVALAERVGERIGRELGIPVYLYGEAARVPARRELAPLRRGGLEGLAQRIGGELVPDFGPQRLHPSAGASAVGARWLLIAYNVELESEDLELARAIARQIREAGGGLAGVRALGLRLQSRAAVQVSTNIVDFRKSSMARVFERVRELAAARGVAVRRSELVGLVPRAAVLGAARDALRLPELDASRVLEERLEAELLAQRPVRALLEALASSAPAPGGGAAGALAGALAAATAAKVQALAARQQTALRPGADTPAPAPAAAHPPGAPPHAAATAGPAEPLPTPPAAGAQPLARAHEELLELMERDAAAYRRYVQARQQPRATEAERAARSAAMQAALREAAAVPLASAERSVAVLEELARMLPRLGRSVLADAAAAAALAEAAVLSAEAMVRVNLAGLRDPAAAAALGTRIAALRSRAAELGTAVRQRLDAALAPH